MNFELTCLLETELNILGNGEAYCELRIFNYVNIPASQFQLPIKHYFSQKTKTIYCITYEVFYTIKILGLPKAGSLLVEDNEWQRCKKIKKIEKEKQANINISISYLVLLMFLDSIELIYN